MIFIKRKLITVIVFTLTGFALLSFVFFLIDKGVKNSDLEQTGKVNKIVNHSIDPELIIFGSSVSEVGISPAIITAKTGLSCYNCSINGTRFLQYKGLIDEFNGYSKKNRYVVMAESYFSFEKIDALTQAENYLSQIGNDNVYNSLYAIQPDLVWKSRYIPFYKYTAVTSRFYKNSLIGWKNILSGSYNNDKEAGYYPVSRNWEADADEAIRNTTAFNIHLDSAIIAEYIKTIKTISSGGKKVLIILTPTYTAILQRITNIEPLRDELQKIALETGAIFLDFTRNKISIEKIFFYNSTHMNIEGSKQFTSILADSILQIEKKSKL